PGVADLLVLSGPVAPQSGRVQLEPGFNTFLLAALGDFFHQLDGARAQFAALPVQADGTRRAPVALTGDTPVRTTGDHAVQTGLTPGWNELGLLDGIQRAGTQGAAVFGDLVHADEPLGGGPVDQRGLVAPAVHVAVLDGFVLEQRADFV